MALCGSETTTTTKTGPLSGRGQSYDNLFNSVLMTSLDDAGFDVDFTEKTVYTDQPKADEFLGKIQEAKTALANPNISPGEKESISEAIASLQEGLNGLESAKVKDYNLKKRPDPAVQYAIEKYGEGSPQALEAAEKVKLDGLKQAMDMQDVQKSYISNLKKLADGDMSFTAEQEQQVDAFIKPIRNIISKTTADLLATYGKSDAMMREALKGVAVEIDKTGYDIGSALEAASVQYEQSGKNLMSVLEQVNSSDIAKSKFEFDLLSKQADTQASQQAALLGLPPGSQAEKSAAMKMKTDALKSIQLDFDLRNKNSALQIQQGVETGKTNISLSKVALAENQGAKKEDLAKQGFGLTQLLTQKQEGILGNAANANISLEQQKQNMLYDAAYGGLAGRVGAGQSALGFDLNQKLAKQNGANALLAPIAGQLGVEQQLQMANTTTTQKQQKGLLDTITGLGGAAASAYAAFATGGASTALSAAAGAASGGGNSAPQTFMPSPQGLDLSLVKNTNSTPLYLDY